MGCRHWLRRRCWSNALGLVNVVWQLLQWHVVSPVQVAAQQLVRIAAGLGWGFSAWGSPLCGFSSMSVGVWLSLVFIGGFRDGLGRVGLGVG